MTDKLAKIVQFRQKINKYTDEEVVAKIAAGQFDILPLSGIAFCGGLITSISTDGKFTFADNADTDTTNVEIGLTDASIFVVELVEGKAFKDLNDILGVHTVGTMNGTEVPISGLSSTLAQTYSGALRWRLPEYDRWLGIISLATFLGVAHKVDARSITGDSLSLSGSAGGTDIALSQGMLDSGQYDKVTNGDATHSLKLIRG